MKKILYLISFLLVISCSKDKDENEEIVADERMADSAMTNIYASGKVSEQTPAEAKQTILESGMLVGPLLKIYLVQRVYLNVHSILLSLQINLT